MEFFYNNWMAILGLLSAPLAYFFGGKQKQKSELKKTDAEAWHNAGLENFRLWQRYTAWPLLRSEGLQIYTLYNPLKPSLGHYADPLHPNDTGYEVLANVIYLALRNIFAVDYVAPTIIPKLVGVNKLIGITKITI